METSEKVKQIKRSFRLLMNGVTAASMRKKGLEYKINWGVSQMDLRRMAEQYKGDKALAEALWEEKNIRECRLLATLIMPADEMDVEQALKWAEDASTIELMESAVFNLFQHIDNAASLADKMLASTDENVRTGAYNLACRIMKRNYQQPDSLFKHLFEQASNEMHTQNRALLHAIINCLTFISAEEGEHAQMADKILEEAGY